MQMALAESALITPSPKIRRVGDISSGSKPRVPVQPTEDAKRNPMAVLNHVCLKLGGGINPNMQVLST